MRIITGNTTEASDIMHPCPAAGGANKERVVIRNGQVVNRVAA